MNTNGRKVITPDKLQRKVVHDIIFNQLRLGDILEISRQSYIDIINSLQRQGAEAVILGDTESGLLFQQEHVIIHDTTGIYRKLLSTGG